MSGKTAERPMKILVTDGVDEGCIEILAREGFGVDNRPSLAHDELVRIIDAYDGLVVRSASQVGADVIGNAALLRVIGRAGTGVDNIDLPAATRRGILVMNTPGGNTVSAAEHTVSMMLSLARNIPQAHASLKAGKWDRKKFTGTEVMEKTIGIIGLGKIGREVAQRSRGLGMKVIGYDPVLSADVAARLSIELVSLEELYRRSDIITVHTPLTPDTRGMLNDRTFQLCKKGVRVINCARGGIVDEGALLRALESGQVGGAALDVFEQEPPHGSPLLAHERVVVTPHLGASTEEAQEKVAVQIAHQIADALRGRGYAGLVNGSAMHLTLKEEVRPYLLLAERMGSLAMQLSGASIRKVVVGGVGGVVMSSLELMKAGVLKGILTHTVPEPVNIVNAPYLAEEMGLACGELRGADDGDFTSLLSIRFDSGRETRELAGTAFGTAGVRLVRMDGFRFDVNPEGYLLVYYNIDRPGMLAGVGSILARHGVNIAGVSLGRSGVGARALTVMNIDSAIPGPALGELAAVGGVTGLRVVHLE